MKISNIPESLRIFFVIAATSVVSIAIYSSFFQVRQNNVVIRDEEDVMRHGFMDFVKQKADLLNPSDELDECDIYTMDSFIFYSQYLTMHKPCVFRKANMNWTAVHKWANETYLQEKLHNKYITVEVKEDNRFAYFLHGFEKENITYSDFLKKYKDPYRDRNYYWAEGEFPEELIDDVLEPAFSRFMNLDYMNIWQGYGGTVSLAHTDARENFLCQIIGTKELIIAAPYYRSSLYAQNGHKDIPPNYSPVDFLNPDYDKFPLFYQVKTYTVIIEPGDFLYLPSFWWHYVRSSKGVNMAVNYWYTTHSKLAEIMYMAVESNTAN